MNREQVIEQALALSQEDREFVAAAIESSLVNDALTDPNVRQAWAAEIERRIAAYDRGEMTAVPADVAIAAMRQKLGEFRSRQESP